MRAIDEVDEAQSCTVVLVQPHLARVVFTGELVECQSWLALNGDKVAEGHYEIRDEARSPLPPRPHAGSDRSAR